MGGEGGFKGGTIYNPRTPGRRYAKQNSGRLTRQNSPGSPRTGSSVEIPTYGRKRLKTAVCGLFYFLDSGAGFPGRKFRPPDAPGRPRKPPGMVRARKRPLKEIKPFTGLILSLIKSDIL